MISEFIALVAVRKSRIIYGVGEANIAHMFTLPYVNFLHDIHYVSLWNVI